MTAIQSPSSASRYVILVGVMYVQCSNGMSAELSFEEPTGERLKC